MPLLPLRVAAAALVLAIAAGLPARAQALPEAFVPGPPPAPGTPADLADRAAVAATWPAERIALADRDRILDPFAAFAGVIGPDFAPAYLPATTQLLTDVLYLASGAVVEAKDAFARLRPFVTHPALAICPGAELVEPDRSWPSGHAAIGYAWAVVLADLMPDRAEAILERGRDYGTSRVVCGVHWPSDVAEGQALGAAIATTFLADPRLAGLRDAARAELALLGPMPRG